MTEPATLLALAAEVEAGTGPDRELDVRIHGALGLGEAMEEPPGWPWQRSSCKAARSISAGRSSHTARISDTIAS